MSANDQYTMVLTKALCRVMIMDSARVVSEDVHVWSCKPLFTCGELQDWPGDVC